MECVPEGLFCGSFAMRWLPRYISTVAGTAKSPA
jgi:hypothetical protein